MKPFNSKACILFKGSDTEGRPIAAPTELSIKERGDRIFDNLRNDSEPYLFPRYLHKYLKKIKISGGYNTLPFIERAISVGLHGLSTDMYRLITFTLPAACDYDGHLCTKGDTGSGKELVAEYIFKYGPKKWRDSSKNTENNPKRFHAVNCAAYPYSLLEALLFGIGNVATDVPPHAGLFENADGGTVFLDELPKMPINHQSKLLRILESRDPETKKMTFCRVGESKIRHSDFRCVFAINDDPFKLIAEGRLLKDLYYRISTHVIELPSLTSRTDEHIKNGVNDIELLFEHFILSYINKEEVGIEEIMIPREWLELLKARAYPGNVRELRNICHRMIDYVKFIYKQSPISGNQNSRRITGNQFAVLLLMMDPSFFIPITKKNEPIPEVVQEYESIRSIENLHKHHAIRMYKMFGSYIKAAEAMGVTRQQVSKWVKAK